VLTDAGVVEHYAMQARDNHWSARFNKISLDQAGNPSPAELHPTLAASARVVRLTPRLIKQP
jgi:hypothetical protein